MNRKMMSFALITLALSLILSGCTTQGTGKGEDPAAWPSKPINVVVPAGAGGGTDLGARIVSKYLTQELGQPVNITNIKGAGGSVGSEEVLESDNDGYTMLYYHEDIVTNEQLGIVDFGYRDFDVAGKIYDIDLIGIISGPKYKNMEDVKEAALKNPGQVSFAVDLASFSHLLPYIMENEMNIDLKIIEAGGLNDRIPLLMSGQVDLCFAPIGVVKDYVTSGGLSALGIVSEERSLLYEELPTLKEQNIDIVGKKFFNYYFPKGTNPEIITKFQEALKAVSINPEFIQEAKDIFYNVNYADTKGAIEYLEETEVILNENKALILNDING